MRLLTSALLLVLVGCPKEEPVKTGIVAKEGGITEETEVPADKDSRAFADHLIRTPMRDFKPTDSGGGVSLEWNKVTFGPKNHFEADAVMKAGGENVNCTEAGRWSMEKATRSDQAVVELLIKKTTCPGRNDGVKYRLQLDAHSETYSAVFL